jgi:hypothetical protein
MLKTRANNKRKFITSYGVAIEPWTDFRRTGILLLYRQMQLFHTKIIFYPQSEIDLILKMLNKSRYECESFWDTRS